MGTVSTIMTKLRLCVLGLDIPKTFLGEHEYCILWTILPEIGKIQVYSLLNSKTATRMRTTRYGKTLLLAQIKKNDLQNQTFTGFFELHTISDTLFAGN